MATDKEFITFLLDTLKPVGNISARPMFGEYGLYYEEKLIGLVCDNQMLIKITPAGWSVLERTQPPGKPTLVPNLFSSSTIPKILS